MVKKKIHKCKQPKYWAVKICSKKSFLTMFENVSVCVIKYCPFCGKKLKNK